MNDIINTYNEIIDSGNSDIDNFMESLRYNKRGIVISEFLTSLKDNNIPFIYVRSFNHTSDKPELTDFSKIVIESDKMDELKEIDVPYGIELNIDKNIEINCLL